MLFGCLLKFFPRQPRRGRNSLQGTLRIITDRFPIYSIEGVFRVLLNLGRRSNCIKEEELAARKRRSQLVSSFTSLLSNWVVDSSARETADALLELLDIFLV